MKKKFYIKERYNPQFDDSYYVALGQISQRKAKTHESTLYGINKVFAYENEDEYNAAIRLLKEQGLTVHD